MYISPVHTFLCAINGQLPSRLVFGLGVILFRHKKRSHISQSICEILMRRIPFCCPGVSIEVIYMLRSIVLSCIKQSKVSKGLSPLCLFTRPPQTILTCNDHVNLPYFFDASHSLTLGRRTRMVDVKAPTCPV